jgi:hypothetical protein
VLFTAKCFWPGVTENTLRTAASRAGRRRRHGSGATFRGALYLPGDQLVLCLFESSAASLVKSASEGAGMPCERVIQTVWIPPDRHEGGGTSQCATHTPS